MSQSTPQPIVVSALYHFVALDDYQAMRQPLYDFMMDNHIKGTILLAKEGINGTVAGIKPSIDRLHAWLRSDARLKDLRSKESFDDSMPFYRTRVKLKKEIVTMGVPDIDPNHIVGTYVKPEDWNALISDPDVTIIDTRNDYEYAIGSFKNAINPKTETFRQFPIKFIAEFYRNHGLLGVANRPQWRVIKGGSRQYIGPLTREWADRIRVNSPIESVERGEDGSVFVRVAGDKVAQRFEHVIFACHSDQALRILGSAATATESEILSAFPYHPNEAILHTQESVLPKNKRAWACWNYLNPKRETERATVTYNMNMLQSLKAAKTFCVTLNDAGRIKPENIIRSFNYDHPTFDSRRKAMQLRHDELLATNSTSFCGAYWGNGFHEDGVKSAIAVTDAIGVLNCQERPVMAGAVS